MLLLGDLKDIADSAPCILSGSGGEGPVTLVTG